MITWSTILPVIVPTVALGGGVIFSYGKLKASMISRKECRENQKYCNEGVFKAIQDLKTLTIDLHNRQTDKIDSLQEKLETTNVSMGKIQGFLTTIHKKNKG